MKFTSLVHLSAPRWILVLLFLSSCQSVANYLQYRAYDFRDMFTIGVEKNVAGGSFFVWCFGGGLQYGSEGEGYGLRGVIWEYIKLDTVERYHLTEFM